MSERRSVGFLSESRGAAAVLGAGILAAAALVLYTAHGATFAVDELYYYGRVAVREGGLIHYPSAFDPHYLLAPFNGHLALGGRFIYELVFATLGANYTVFLLIDFTGIALSAILVFALIRRRIGTPAALAPCLLLLFLGFAREQFLWPIDFNSSLALATGLGAVLALQRQDLRGDLLGFVLLSISAAMIEVGVAFGVGIAVMILIQPNRWRRLWIVIVPAVLYAAWWLWATPRFGGGETELSNIVLVPKAFLHGLGGTLGALTGTNPVVPGSTGGEVTWFGGGLAILAALALAVRIRIGSLPVTFWVWLTTLATYWLLLGIAARPPEESRYLLVSGALVILIAADTVRRPLSNRAAGLLFVIVLLALPANIDQLVSGRHNDVFHADAPKTKIDFAMVELAREHVDPNYVVSSDPKVAEAGGALFLGLPAGAILDATAQNGALGYSLAEIRGLPEEEREIADAAISGALGVDLLPAAPPAPPRVCKTIHAPSGEASIQLPHAPAYLLAHGSAPVLVAVRRFASSGPGVPIAELRPGGWARLNVPSDPAPDPWSAVFDGPTTVCFAK